MPGTFIQEGQEMLTVGANECKELRVSVRQTDLPIATAKVNEELPVRVGTRSPMHGRLLWVTPRATRRLPHPALAATSGGSLPVVEEPGKQDANGESSLLLTEQRFDAVVGFDPQQAMSLRCGELGTVALGQPQCSVAIYCYRASRRWLEDRLAAAKLSEDLSSMR
jgi:putative peptide zinc metalloprotease protein